MIILMPLPCLLLLVEVEKYMGYNFESSKSENFNEVPEVSTESDNALELDETEEDYDDVTL